MQQFQTTLTVKTPGTGFTDLTAQIRAEVRKSAIETGLCTLFVKHTSASLVIQENADPDVLRDLSTFMLNLVPETFPYRHTDEGPDDMPAHIRSVLTHTSESIPITSHQLALGTWQAIYLWEHRHRPHHREIVVHIAGVRG